MIGRIKDVKAFKNYSNEKRMSFKGDKVEIFENEKRNIECSNTLDQFNIDIQSNYNFSINQDQNNLNINQQPIINSKAY